MLEIMIYTIQIIFLLYITGLGVSALLLPEKFKNDVIWFAPWLGTIFIALFGVYESMIGIPMKTGAYAILFILGLLTLYQIYKKNIVFALKKEHVIISLLTLFVFIFNIYPLIFRVGFPTTISLGNLDPISYAISGDYLVDHTVFEKLSQDPYNLSIGTLKDIIGYSFRWGSVLVFSFFNTLLHLKVYQYYNILITIYFALTYSLVYILSRFLFSKNWILLAFITFLTYGINSTLLYMLYNVFFGQIVFTGVMMLSLIFFNAYIRDSKKNTFVFNKYDFLVALTLSSVTTLYPDGFILVYIPLLCFAALSFLIKRRALQIIRVAKISLLTILINPITFATMSKWLIRMVRVTTSDSPIGWENIRYAMPLEILGFYNLYYSRNIPISLDILFGFAIISVMIIGLLKIKKRLFLICYILFFGIFYVFFRFISPNFFVYHRAVTYSTFIYSVLFSIGAVILLSYINKKIITASVISIMIILSARSAHRTFYQFYHHYRVVDLALISLQSLNENEKIRGPFITSDIYSKNYDVWTRLWREYMLSNKKIISLQNYSFVKKYGIDDALVLSEKDISQSYSPAILYEDIVWENNYYKLGNICKSDKCLLKSPQDLSGIDFKKSLTQDSLKIDGWDAREVDHQWISSSEATLRLVTKKPSTKLVFQAHALKEPQSVSIYINNIFIKKLNLSTKLQIYTIESTKATKIGVNLIRFVFTHGYSPAKIYESSDTRVLYGNFFSIALD